MGIKAVFRDWLPPVILRNLRKGWHFVGRRWSPEETDLPDWEYSPLGWNSDDGVVGGWNQSSVADIYAQKWPLFLERIAGTQPLGVNHEAIGGPGNDCLDTHNQVMTLAYVVGRAARHRDRLSVLDFGGALGHHLAFLRILFPEIHFDYWCCETTSVATRGRMLHPQAFFFADDSWKERSFDLILASNSFHYAPAWEERLAQFAQAARFTVFITKLPVVQEVSSFVILQRAWKYGYRTEYLGWCLNRKSFLAAARERGLILEREFLVFGHEPRVVGASENFRHKGFLFRKEPPGEEVLPRPLEKE